jgi:ADP-ribose pyrophosphatase YjhB (NUDIX family)
MKPLLTIRDSDVGWNYPDTNEHQERQAARAIVYDKEGKVALLHATKKSYHKLPGGGVEQGESIMEALHREVMEEIGCKIEHIRELGIVEEFRNKFKLHQLSYVYIADLAGEKGTPDLEEDEIADGFETVWLTLDEAIESLKKETSIDDYEGRFIQKRDLALLISARKNGR